jgi:hypothetical protein
MRPGPYRCGCNPTYGQSCPDCDGTAAEQREIDRLPPAERTALRIEHLRLRGELPTTTRRTRSD